MELGISPAGKLHSYPVSGQSIPKVITRAFEHDTGEGLFALAAQSSTSKLSTNLCFWREFACAYMAERCRTPEPGAGLEPIDFAMGDEQCVRLIGGAPPMTGAEYLSVNVLEWAWWTLDDWLRGQVNRGGGTLGDFLKKRAPHWHQVGRVCFHLAENKNDRECPFAFMATYVPHLSDSGQAKHQPLGNALRQYAGVDGKNALINLLSPVDLASKSSPLIRELVESGDIYYPLAWTPAEAYQFIREVPLYENAGLSVRLPDWWQKRARPQVTVQVGSNIKTGLTAASLLSFDVSISLGDQTLSAREWEEFMAAEAGLVLLKGRWVEVDPEKLAQTLAHWKKVEAQASEEGIGFIEGMRLLSGSSPDLSPVDARDEEQKWLSVQAGTGLRRALERLHGTRAPRPGKALRATLRPYQETGLNWLWQLSQLKLGACLADDMGLGKTLQVIALLLVIKKQTPDKPSLLVLPASLLGNWKDELARFAPTLDVLFVHPSHPSHPSQPSQEKRGQKNGRDQALPAGKDLVITTYGMLLRQDWLLERDWQLAILDEAQAIKNPASRQTRAVKKLRAESRIALTGTPVENRLSDLWSLFDFICPGLLGTAKRFQTFVKSLEAREHERFAPLRNLVQPYILRRLKTDQSIIADLPGKTEMLAYCGLGKRQAALYRRSVEELAAVLDKENEGIKRRGLVLAYLLRFKQICNHPAQWLGDGDYRPEDSGKFARLAELCEEIAARQEKVLVFTQFREMTEPLAAFLGECFGRPGLILHGGTPVAQRKQRVDRFQQDDGPPFFVLSIKAGGTGLNLTQASHVIHFDRWWNPAVENQATDRVFRIGQKRNVLVHKFVCRGTVEDKIDALITEKQALADDVVEHGAETLLTEMSNDDLLDLVSLDLENIDL